MQKTIAIVVIIPEYKYEHDILTWEKTVQWAESMFKKGRVDFGEGKREDGGDVEKKDVDVLQRWALGYVGWQKMVDYLEVPNCQVFYVRTDYRLTEQEYEIDNETNIISVQHSSDCGHIAMKSMMAFKILYQKFDYIVRGNLNSLIDLGQISRFIQKLPRKRVFTSPFWEGGSYPFGYFFLISQDVAKYLIHLKPEKYARWLQEPTADDYEITRLILKKYQHYVLDGCDRPLVKNKKSNPKKNPTEKLKKIPTEKLKKNSKEKLKEKQKEKSKNKSTTKGPKRQNKHGVLINSVGSLEELKSMISKLPMSVFVFRVKLLEENRYVEFYDYLIKYFWDKIVRRRYNDMVFVGETDRKVPHLQYERDEQLLVAKYVRPDDVVLELGARYGSVSCIINRILREKTNQVSVEPDKTVLKALEKNRKKNGSNFHIYEGIISQNNYDLSLLGYGSTIDLTKTLSRPTIKIDNISLEDLQIKYGLCFNVLVADCEGFLETFLNENPWFYDQLRMIIFEGDRGDICNYAVIKSNLIKHGFTQIEIAQGFHFVYQK